MGNNDTLVGLVAELFTAIKLLSGYPIPDTLPEVHVVPPTQIHSMLCKGKPCGIKAFYLPDRGIFVSDTVDPSQDTFARSILLHELVHHVQHLSGRFDRIGDQCDRWFSKEREAYQVQNAYLQDQGERRRFALDSLPFMCGDRGK
jgi:hypothetical protein